MALLKLDLPAGTSVPSVVAFGDSSQLRPGDSVVAIGTALDTFPNTVSEGTVNGMHRSLGGSILLPAMIQNDAEIWQGDAGGPLLNLQGEVIGVNTTGIGSGMMGTDTSPASMGFAVESNVACKAAAELLADGHIVWPYLAIQAESTTQGDNVADVVADGPSAKAGVTTGDVITEVDGQKIDAQHTLLDQLYGQKPGDVVALTVDRNGTTSTRQVTLGERPPECSSDPSDPSRSGSHYSLSSLEAGLRSLESRLVFHSTSSKALASRSAQEVWPGLASRRIRRAQPAARGR